MSLPSTHRPWIANKSTHDEQTRNERNGKPTDPRISSPIESEKEEEGEDEGGAVGVRNRFEVFLAPNSAML